MPPEPYRPISPVRTQPRWLGLGSVKAPDVPDYQHQLFNGCVAKQDVVLHGRIQSLQVHPDIWVHSVEGCDLRTFTSSTSVQQGLHVVIVLEGSVDVAFGNLSLQLPPSAAERHTQAYGALVHTCQPETFVRHWRQGKFERKLSLRVAPRLLQGLAHTPGYTHLQALLEQHLCMQQWQPSARATVLAEQIIHLCGQEGAQLLLQSRALELLHEVVQHPHGNHTPTSAPLHLREHQRVSKLKALLDAHQDRGASVAELARTVGLSASALQRHFRQIHGVGVDEYRRTQRLEHARALLEQTGCSVLEVAHASGYTSAANFSTAFKRHFGISPKLVRSKL